MERKALSDLKLHPRNPRIHAEPGDPEWELLKASLLHDYFDPLVWNQRNGYLVSGHFRQKVMEAEGVEEADVVVVDYGEETHLARMLAANRQMGRDDEPALKVLANELHAGGFNMNVTGFSQDELAPLLDAPASGAPIYTEEDKAHLEAILAQCDEPDVEVRAGECWKLGRHVLYCESLVTGTSWPLELVNMRQDEPEQETLMIPCPDPYVALTERDLVLLLVQPHPVIASYVVSNFQRIYPDDVEQIH